MQNIILRIVLVSGLVLSLFLLLLKAYVEYLQSKQTKHEMNTGIKIEPDKDNALAPKTSVSTIIALGKESNRTLDQAYKSVASEIEDFLNARKVTKRLTSESNISLPQSEEKQFVSQCAGSESSSNKIKPKSNEYEHKISYNPKNTVSIDSKHRFPKVVIIMDDVRSIWQGQMIKKLPVSVTPSIFPVTSDHPDTPKVARMFASYMVHTPMEAFHYSNEEDNTLKTHDSIEILDQRIRQIKQDFPALIAINNHTGSKFTASKEAMDRLFCVLQKYGIRFVDSRTSAKSMADAIAKLHGQKIFSRNVFLDNVDDVGAILARLRETVRYAKKHGVAIAICHPKPQTFEALMRSKKILRGVHVVTLDALYR